MNYYENLTKDIANILPNSTLYIFLLLLHNAYCIGVICVGSYTWVPIPLLILNFLMIFGLTCHIRYLISVDDTSCTKSTRDMLENLGIVYYIGGIYLSIGLYGGCIWGQKKDPFIIAEFIVVIPFLLMLVGFIGVFIFAITVWFASTIKETIKVVNDRNEEEQVLNL